MNSTSEMLKSAGLQPRITVIGVGGAGSNAINNMIATGLTGVKYVAANTDAQSLAGSSADCKVQLGVSLTDGLGAGSKPEIGAAAAEEAVENIRSLIADSHMVFIAAGMGGGTGTGAAAVIARVAKELEILTVGVVTKPFQFEGTRRMRVAEAGIAELNKHVDTLIVIPNQNLFRIANDKTTFAQAFMLADHVLYAGVSCIVDLIVKEGLINLDLADVRTVMAGMGTAMMGTSEASGERRAFVAAEQAISNPLLDDTSLKGAKGVLLSIIGGRDLTLHEVDEAASRIREEVDDDANIIVGATFDESLSDRIRISVVATGMARQSDTQPAAAAPRLHETNSRRSEAPAGVRLRSQDGSVGSGNGAAPPRPQTPTSEDSTRVGTPNGVPPDAELQTARSAPPSRKEAQRAPSSTDPEPWREANGVIIEDGGPHLPPPVPQLLADPATRGSAEFTPAAPEEFMRPPRRQPARAEFSVETPRGHGVTTAGEPTDETLPPPCADPAQAERAALRHRRGLVERITGRAWRRSEPGPSAPNAGLPPERPVAVVEFSGSVAEMHTLAVGRSGPAPRFIREDIELSVTSRRERR